VAGGAAGGWGRQVSCTLAPGSSCSAGSIEGGAGAGPPSPVASASDPARVAPRAVAEAGGGETTSSEVPDAGGWVAAGAGATAGGLGVTGDGEGWLEQSASIPGDGGGVAGVRGGCRTAVLLEAAGCRTAGTPAPAAAPAAPNPGG
jgi:hypothetical protein